MEPNIIAHLRNFAGSSNEIVISLSLDAPLVVQIAWEKFRKNICIQTSAMKFFHKVLKYTELETNTEMIVLHRCESGLGYRQEIIGRQIRPVITSGYNLDNRNYFGQFRTIRFLFSEDNNNQWTNDQIGDIVNAIVKTMNRFLCKDTTYSDNGISAYLISAL